MNTWARSRAVPTIQARLEAILARFSGVPSRSTAGRLGRTDATASTDVLLTRLDAATQRTLDALTDAEVTLDALRDAIGSLPIAVAVSDAHGREIARSAALGELLRGGSSAKVPPDRLGAAIQRCVLSGRAESDLHDVFGPPSTTMSIRSSPVPSAHGTVVVTVVDDVGDARRAEAARRDFVSNLSHELRTPVGAVALLAETIADEDDPATIRQLAGRLEFESQRLASTLQGVLSLNRLETGAAGERSVVDFTALVRGCVARHRNAAELVGIELVMMNDDDAASLPVRSDRALLDTAVGNLIENAVKYSDKGEPVRVRVQRVDHDGRPFAQVSVEDTGIGIPLRDRQRIFERFYRVDRARHRDTGGSGLGLAMVRHVAVSHDGDVSVDSLEGVGSTFRLRIPLDADGAR